MSIKRTIFSLDFFDFFSILILPDSRTAIWLSFTEPFLQNSSVFPSRASSPAVKARTLSSRQPIAVNHTKWDALLSESSRLTSQSTQVQLVHWTESHAHPDQFSLQIVVVYFNCMLCAYIYIKILRTLSKIVASELSVPIFFSLFVELQFILLTKTKTLIIQCLPLNAW